MSKSKIATMWLDGCSGCHMSFLDIDEKIIDLLQKADIVYSPLVDIKKMPDEIDFAIVEGAVGSDENLEQITHLRKHVKFLIALGDCAVTGNVPAMRNVFKIEEVLARSYIENTDIKKNIPVTEVPKLRPIIRPIHGVVHVDLYVPGCPPPSDAIYYVLTELIDGRTPDPIKLTRFGK